MTNKECFKGEETTFTNEDLSRLKSWVFGGLRMYGPTEYTIKTLLTRLEAAENVFRVADTYLENWDVSCAALEAWRKSAGK